MHQLMCQEVVDLSTNKHKLNLQLDYNVCQILSRHTLFDKNRRQLPQLHLDHIRLLYDKGHLMQ